jgi:DNA-binding NarL/FixJ family response regulator
MKIRILIADDKIPFLDTAIRYLNLNDKVELIAWALTGKEAIEKTKQFKPDLLLIDLSLPEGGWETIQKMKQVNQNLKIVVLTIHTDSVYKYQAKAAGADGFILKDEFVVDFNDTVDNLFKE